MSFEMSLPHAPRIQAIGLDGSETLAQDEQQWDLYYTVQRALAAQQEGGGGEEADGDTSGTKKEQAAAGKAAQPSDPQKVLQKLLSARGELDVISDLVTFVEQQQFLAVAGIQRHPPPLEERVRTRCLRLAGAKQQLRRAAERLAGGAAALRAQEVVETRFLADLANLRRLWRLRRHAGEGGMFYADLSLPLRGAAGEGISQEGAQCNIVQDTNGDACIVESESAGGKRRAVRGWQAIDGVLAAKQQLLSWQVLSQVAAAQARQQEYAADPDGAVAAVQRLLNAALAACQADVYAAVVRAGMTAGSGGPSAMEVDQEEGSPPASGAQQGTVGAAGTAAAAGAESAGTASAAGTGAAEQLGGGGSSDRSDPMLSSAARDIRAALCLPGFQQHFEARALHMLAQLLPGGGGSGGSGGSGMAPAAAGGPQHGLFAGLLRWLHHTALCHRVNGALGSWAAAAEGRALSRVESGEEFTAVWQLQGCRGGEVAPVLAIAVGDCLRLQGGQVAAAAQRQRGLTRAEFERALQAL